MPEGRSYKELAKFYTPGIFAFLAAILGTAGNLYCETVEFPNSDSSQNIYGGLFSYHTDVETTCRPYSDLERNGFEYEVDAKTRTARAFSILTPIIGGFALLVACLGPCCTVRAAQWKKMGALFLVCSLFQGLTLLVVDSSICHDNPVLQSENYNADSDSCEWYTGLYLSIIAVVLWFLAGVAALVLPAPHVDPRQPQQTQTVTYQRNPDGTIQETDVEVVKGTNVASPGHSAPMEGAKTY